MGLITKKKKNPLISHCPVINAVDIFMHVFPDFLHECMYICVCVWDLFYILETVVPILFKSACLILFGRCEIQDWMTCNLIDSSFSLFNMEFWSCWNTFGSQFFLEILEYPWWVTSVSTDLYSFIFQIKL